MGNQLVWNERYNLGVEVIDKEHKRLFKILSKLFDLGEQEEKNQWVCQEAVKFFKSHALQHFADEEKYMDSIGYEGAAMHRRTHKNFREITLPALEKELAVTHFSERAIDHFIGVCAGWLIGHTLIEDQAIVGRTGMEMWESLLPEEEQAVMGQAIVSLLYSMFQLDSKLISNCYAGEKFGEGVYYRLIYKTAQKKRWEFMLVLEEQLIVHTIGSVIDTNSATINVMLMNAARYTSRQFVEHIKGHFSELAEAEIEKEQLLNYEQFQKVFEKNSPQFSLLFDTGKGYFAYCMTTAEEVSNDEAVSIITENAMNAVEQYLDMKQIEKEEISHKKKILVVDDSDFLLNTMRQLLSADYELFTATSGLSAFRSITLDRPDLVLLDYTMPVCDGNQILEMIRSEKAFADIPVIFLTSRVDKESVKKVVKLKPQGYLPKSLPLEKIKKEIDRFFECQAEEKK